MTDELIAKPLLSITAHTNTNTHTNTHMHKLKFRPLNPVTEYSSGASVVPCILIEYFTFIFQGIIVHDNCVHYYTFGDCLSLTMKSAWSFETSGTTCPAQCMYQNTWVCPRYPLYEQLIQTAAAICEEKLQACNTSYYMYNCHILESSSLAHHLLIQAWSFTSALLTLLSPTKVKQFSRLKCL